MNYIIVIFVVIYLLFLGVQIMIPPDKVARIKHIMGQLDTFTDQKNEKEGMTERDEEEPEDKSINPIYELGSMALAPILFAWDIIASIIDNIIEQIHNMFGRIIRGKRAE